MSILHFDRVHIINITCLIIINIIMTIFNISTLIIRAARDSGAKGDCRRLQRGCPLSIFNMPLFNSPWFQLNVYNCPLLISYVQVLDRPLPAIAVIKHIFHFAAFWKIVLLFGVKCFSPDCLWLIVALFCLPLGWFSSILCVLVVRWRPLGAGQDIWPQILISKKTQNKHRAYKCTNGLL